MLVDLMLMKDEDSCARCWQIQGCCSVEGRLQAAVIGTKGSEAVAQTQGGLQAVLMDFIGSKTDKSRVPDCHT